MLLYWLFPVSITVHGAHMWIALVICLSHAQALTELVKSFCVLHMSSN